MSPFSAQHLTLAHDLRETLEAICHRLQGLCPKRYQWACQVETQPPFVSACTPLSAAVPQPAPWAPEEEPVAWCHTPVWLEAAARRCLQPWVSRWHPSLPLVAACYAPWMCQNGRWWLGCVQLLGKRSAKGAHFLRWVLICSTHVF